MDERSFRGVFITIIAASVVLVGVVLINSLRPRAERTQPSAALARATGRCAQCHLEESSAVVHQFERSLHAVEKLTCLDCHRPQEGQESVDHRGFTIATEMTAGNCSQCHSTQYDQMLRSRHAAPAWAAVNGAGEFAPEQIAFSEQYHPGAVDRPANALAILEGQAAAQVGCEGCHRIGRPNSDGTIGTCIDCHGAHAASIALARQPETCGQCHMGPDHSQIEIYKESKHGVLFSSQRNDMNLSADPTTLTTEDMSVPTCATCHMSGLEGSAFTHDVTERLSYWLFAAVSERRPTYAQGQAAMKDICVKCHARPRVDEFYEAAEAVVESTNERVAAAMAIVDGLRADGLLTPEPFDEPIEFLSFDYWHYFGRTAKHGAFMGGADFVQWHGNYELLLGMVELRHMADEIRRNR